MRPCPWKNNPLRRLSAKIVKENFEVYEPFSHLGIDLLIPGPCLLCPYLFEGGCTYPYSPTLPAGQTPKLASWVVGTGKTLRKTASTTLSRLQAQLKETVPTLLIMILASPNEMTLQDLNETLKKISSSFPKETCYIWHFKPGENPEPFIFLCAWTTDLANPTSRENPAIRH
ncbi:MAG: hypothetical protein PWQ74_578 [Methanobacteriaceae archaeon]|nr:hypothetical protein [Methanobacteriaceae archaeon]